MLSYKTSAVWQSYYALDRKTQTDLEKTW
jgi:hypothetical protein